MVPLSFSFIIIALLRLTECSRGDVSDIPKEVEEERNLPLSPVQAYRKKLQERARSEPVRHAVRPFPIGDDTNIIDDTDGSRNAANNSPTTTPATFTEYMQPLSIPVNNSIGSTSVGLPAESMPPGPMDRESPPPMPVYRDTPVAPPAAYARSSDGRFVFPASGELRPRATTTDPLNPSNYYKISDSAPSEADKPTNSDRSNPDPPVSGSSAQESRIVEFKGCLMRDFEKVWSSPVRPGHVFVPRNEIEFTCRGYIEKIEQLRNQCVEAMETLLIAKTKAAQPEESEKKKSWWRFLTFGRR